jgi:hypothetical protein
MTKILNIIHKNKKITTSSTSYVDIISEFRIRAKTHVKNISYFPATGQESKTLFKVKIGSQIEVEDEDFTEGLGFSQDFNVGEFVLEPGDRIYIKAKSSDGTSISPQASITLLEEPR